MKIDECNMIHPDHVNDILSSVCAHLYETRIAHATLYPVDDFGTVIYDTFNAMDLVERLAHDVHRVEV